MNKRITLFLISLIIIISCGAQTEFTNPVLKPGTFSNTTLKSLADPGVFRDSDGTYYMYVTGTGYPAFSSKDLVNWKYEKKVFTGTNRKWATTGFWAPEVFKYNDKYYLTYTAAIDAPAPKRIGLAVSSSPLGPFVDINDHPFYIKSETRGTIDSHFFIDDDKKVYMYYTCDLSDEYLPDASKKRSEIWVVEVANDLSSPVGTPKMLTHPEQSWEFKPNRNSFWNEGVEMVKHNKTYYLMFSANCFCSPDYGIGYATSGSPTGPFVKSEDNPILSRKGVPEVSGTGHHSVVLSPDGTEMFCIYHSHLNINDPGGIRMINIDRMGFDKNGKMYINGPTISPQPYPSNRPLNLKIKK